MIDAGEEGAHLRFLKTSTDPHGTVIRVENGFRDASGKHFLLVRRLPPEHAKPPVFLVELSGDRLEVRGSADPQSQTYYKAYAIQGLTDAEKKLLGAAERGKRVPRRLGLGLPLVSRVMGRQFHCLSDAELRPLLDSYVWKLVGGQR